MLDTIKMILSKDNNNKYILIILCIALLVMLFVSLYSTYSYIRDNNVISTRLNSAYERIVRANNRRLYRAEKLEILGDTTEKDNILRKVDKLVLYSGIGNKHKIYNTNFIVSITIIMSVMTLSIVSLNFGIVYGIIGGIVVIMLVDIILLTLSHIQYCRIKNQMLDFLKLMQNYSRTRGDLVSILERVYYSGALKSPLKEMVFECVSDAKNGGNILAALTKFENKVQHEFLKLAIRNLQVEAKGEADYVNAIETNIVLIEEQLIHEDEIRSINQKARINNIIIAVLGALSIHGVSLLNEDGLSAIELLKSYGSAGQFVLYTTLVVIIVIIYRNIVGIIKH